MIEAWISYILFYKISLVFIAITFNSVGVYDLYLGGGGFDEKVSFSLFKNPDIWYDNINNLLQ